MNIYCYVHNTVEHLTVGEAHDLLQALLADIAGERADPANPPEPGEHRSYMDYQDCPVSLLRAYRDPEMYYEHLQQCNESRLAK